jgi:hypothetical protein
MLIGNCASSILLTNMANNEATCHYRFQGLPDFFLYFSQDYEPNSSSPITTAPRFGLIDREYSVGSVAGTNNLLFAGGKPWKCFNAYVEHLNEQAPESTRYKVLYITRHGLGHHNTFEARVGRDAWNVSNPSLFA